MKEHQVSVNDEDFKNVLAGLEQAVAIETGAADAATFRLHVPAKVDVKAVRKRLRLTQVDFAARFGFSTGAVRDWEQRRKTPEPAARVLLTIIDREPEAVRRALRIA